MKNLMEQRVCSNVVAGIGMATRLLAGRTLHEETEDVDLELDVQDDAERAAPERLIPALGGVGDDPKLSAIRYDLFGALPDTIRDEWIDDIETLGERMDQYIEERRRATCFDLRYNETIRPSDDAWRDCATVLARRDVE